MTISDQAVLASWDRRVAEAGGENKADLDDLMEQVAADLGIGCERIRDLLVDRLLMAGAG